MLKEFKEFALKGNVLDLAVAVIMGIAFGAVVNSLVKDVIMNFVAAIAGEPDFSALTFAVGDGVILYGAFLTALANFLIIALVMFFIVRVANKMAAKRGDQDEDEEIATAECRFCLTEIPAEARRCPACTSQLRAREAA